MAPSLDEESKTKTISVGLSPHTEGVVPVKGYSGLKQSPGLIRTFKLTYGDFIFINESLYYSIMLITLFDLYTVHKIVHAYFYVETTRFNN